ncbi:hypothetical protein [Mesorhizobium delmotii]|uniref:Uncharacterized protein n=1 Tax=Mesorhizobium delmotii TaxID=1631247 RepID=A0A2P9APN5_9HYPH|nr:hypothetical protein [Mesorhizobium delmotii]SJM33108.1 hypothetical protein BQ8482_340004 [Mesorhizobium delmotii]
MTKIGATATVSVVAWNVGFQETAELFASPRRVSGVREASTMPSTIAFASINIALSIFVPHRRAVRVADGDVG